MTENNPSKQKFSITFIVSIVISVLLVLSIVGFALYLKNYDKNKIIAPAPKHYILPENYTNNDLFKAYAKIRKDKEFRVYFRVLTKKQIQEAFVATTHVLNENQNDEELLKIINMRHGKVVQLSEIFYYLNYDEQFFVNPGNYPELNRILEKFLVSEFELTVLGAFYKGTYNPKFSFKWRSIHIRSARKMLLTISRLHTQQNFKR